MNGRRNKPGAPLAPTLMRKRCACGKQATAKQLIQYGVCEVCIKAAAAAQQAGALA